MLQNAVSSLVENLSCPKGIGLSSTNIRILQFQPRIGFQEALRCGSLVKRYRSRVENDAKYTAYLMDGVRPQTWYNHRNGHWIVENDWPKRLQIYLEISS